jgi:hypothetical protein
MEVLMEGWMEELRVGKWIDEGINGRWMEQWRDQEMDG